MKACTPRTEPRRMMRALGLTLALLTLAGCSSHPPLRTVEQVDLERFMGDWYVIASIPTFIERNAYNAVERYTLLPDGTIDTEFTFRSGGFDGREKRYNPRGFVRSDNNAEWGMQFIWPIKAEFLIIHLDADYTQTVIGRSARDYVWIMARTPEIPDEDYAAILEQLEAEGYDLEEIRRVPQRWE